MAKKRIYIANDIEAAGSNLIKHPILSWGACIVTKEDYSFSDLEVRGLTFYSELKPTATEFNIEAMKIGSLGLRCLDHFGDDPHYNPKAPEFDPNLVLLALDEYGETVDDAVKRFLTWISQVIGKNRKIIGLFDTTIFDSARIEYLFSLAKENNPYGWSGIDIDSLFRGYMKDMVAGLKKLGLVDDRPVAHCALDDAIFTAKLARELIYKRISN